jgi:transcriptional regulator with GAF, ATPase, and Fis domain
MPDPETHKSDPLPQDDLASAFKELLRSIAASSRAILPESSQELLQSIVEAAAKIFGAAAASIALVDEKAQELVFKVATGAGNESVVGMRIPIDKGIAGYVAMTGQPIATSNVQTDTRFNQSFAQSTGYVPRSILATPLLSGDRVIGVMEVLDKIASPSFGLQDMELMGLFARQAAIAIHQAEQFSQIDRALINGLRQMAGEDNLASKPLKELLSEDILREPGGVNLEALAERFRAISTLGERETQACLQILDAFAEYARSRKRFNFSPSSSL